MSEIKPASVKNQASLLIEDLLINKGRSCDAAATKAFEIFSGGRPSIQVASGDRNSALRRITYS